MALMLAERAWAYSMQLKEDSEKNSRAKFHANRYDHIQPRRPATKYGVIIEN